MADPPQRGTKKDVKATRHFVLLSIGIVSLIIVAAITNQLIASNGTAGTGIQTRSINSRTVTTVSLESPPINASSFFCGCSSHQCQSTLWC